jgi:hypothetical protein
MGKKELKVEIPGKVYPREWEWIKNKYKGYSFGRLRVPGGWLFTDGLLKMMREIKFRDRCTNHNDFIFIPDPNHEWVLELLKEDPEEETSEVMKELHKKTDEASEDIRKLKRNPEKTNKPWFSRLFRSNNG